MINRGLVIAFAREPFREWLHSLPNPCNITLEEINDDRNAYLIPEFEKDGQRDRALKKVYKSIFESELSDWWVKEEDWPQNRDLRTFRKWFDLKFFPIVEDLAGGDLTDDD